MTTKSQQVDRKRNHHGREGVAPQAPDSHEHEGSDSGLHKPPATLKIARALPGPHCLNVTITNSLSVTYELQEAEIEQKQAMILSKLPGIGQNGFPLFLVTKERFRYRQIFALGEERRFQKYIVARGSEQFRGSLECGKHFHFSGSLGILSPVR